MRCWEDNISFFCLGKNFCTFLFLEWYSLVPLFLCLVLSGCLVHFVSWVLKSPTTRVWGLMCNLGFSDVSFTHGGGLAFGHRCSQLMCFSSEEHAGSFLISFDYFWLKVYLLDIGMATPTSLLCPFFFEIFF